MKTSILAVAALTFVSGAASVVLGQETPAKPAEQTPRVSAQPDPAGRPAVFTDPEFEAIAKLMTGSWKSTAPVPSGTEGQVELVMSIAPVAITEIPNAMYCEISRADALRVPYRQTVLSLRRMGGKIRMETYEFRARAGLYPPAYTMWAAPEVFPDLTGEQLVGTMMYELTGGNGQYTGKTLHPYPTMHSGAVEMSSEIKISADSLAIGDRGFDTEGKQVWGPSAGGGTEFKRFETGIKVDRRESGKIAITYPSTLSGKLAENDDEVSAQYVGYLYDGRMFDTSYDRRQPFKYPYNMGLIEGWRSQMTDTQTGLLRRLIIPAKFGYGEQGRGKSIPPGGTLIFDIEIVAVKTQDEVKASQPQPDPARAIQLDPTKAEPMKEQPPQGKDH